MVVVLASDFFNCGLDFGSGIAGDVSGAVIGPTSVLVDGFREEPETGSAPVLVSSLRLPLAAPSLDRVKGSSDSFFRKG